MFFLKQKNPTRFCGVWEVLWGIPKGFFILTTFRGCTRPSKISPSPALSSVPSPPPPSSFMSCASSPALWLLSALSSISFPTFLLLLLLIFLCPGLPHQLSGYCCFLLSFASSAFWIRSLIPPQPSASAP